MFTKFAAAVALLFALMLAAPVAAHADDQTCTEAGSSDAPYCSPATQDQGSTDVRPATAENGGGSTGSGGGTDVSPASAKVSPAAATAPSGSLPFTGGDVVGLTVIGAGALALGTIMVSRSKRSAVKHAA